MWLIAQPAVCGGRGGREMDRDPDELMAAAFKLNWRGAAAWDPGALTQKLNAAP